MAKQANWLRKEFKCLLAKETNPSLVYVKELRGRNINEKSCSPPIIQPTPGQTHMHSVTQNVKFTSHLPTPLSQSTSASISPVSPQWSSELDTNHGDMIDETIKLVTQTLNQTLIMPNPCNTKTNRDLINPNDNISNLQQTQDINTHTTPSSTKPKLKTDLHKTHLHWDNITSPIANFDKTKQIVTDINKLSHSTTRHNTVLQTMTLNGLYKYDTSQQAYLFEHSGIPVNCTHILVFLKQSACFTVNPETHQWYRMNANEITITRL